MLDKIKVNGVTWWVEETPDAHGRPGFVWTRVTDPSGREVIGVTRQKILVRLRRRQRAAGLPRVTQ